MITNEILVGSHRGRGRPVRASRSKGETPLSAGPGGAWAALGGYMDHAGRAAGSSLSERSVLDNLPMRRRGRKGSRER